MVHANAVRKPMFRLRALAPVFSVICTHLLLRKKQLGEHWSFFWKVIPYTMCVLNDNGWNILPARGLAFGAFSLCSFSFFDGFKFYQNYYAIKMREILTLEGCLVFWRRTPAGCWAQPNCKIWCETCFFKYLDTCSFDEFCFKLATRTFTNFSTGNIKSNLIKL